MTAITRKQKKTSTPSLSASRSSRLTKSNKTPSTPEKAWGGRFTERTHRSVEQFTTSLPYDRRLFEHDIQGSIAHCKTLKKAKVLTHAECNKIIRGLERIGLEIRRGQHEFRDEDEDIHMSIERRLTQLIGPLGRETSYRPKS